MTCRPDWNRVESGALVSSVSVKLDLFAYILKCGIIMKITYICNILYLSHVYLKIFFSVLYFNYITYWTHNFNNSLT